MSGCTRAVGDTSRSGFDCQTAVDRRRNCVAAYQTGRCGQATTTAGRSAGRWRAEFDPKADSRQRAASPATSRSRCSLGCAPSVCFRIAGASAGVASFPASQETGLLIHTQARTHAHTRNRQRRGVVAAIQSREQARRTFERVATQTERAQRRQVAEAARNAACRKSPSPESKRSRNAQLPRTTRHIAPVSRFPPMSRECKFVKFPIASGMRPGARHPEKINQRSRAQHVPADVPSSDACFSDKLVKRVRLPTVGGSSPVRQRTTKG